MLILIENAIMKLEELERAGVSEARALIADLKEFVGWHKAQALPVVDTMDDPTATAELPAGYASVMQAGAAQASSDPAPTADTQPST